MSNSKLQRAHSHIELMAAQGMHGGLIAADIQCSYAYLMQYCARVGIEIAPQPREHRPPRSPNEREQAMGMMFKQGLTMEKIGQQYGITRERVRQLLGRCGLSGCDGGLRVSVKHAKTQADRRRRLAEARREAKWGVDIELCRELRTTGVIKAYEMQQKNARARGISFTITFAEWYAVWQISGKLHLRGRGKGRYCMSRIKDAGGYELGNVHVQLATTNGQEAVAKWKGKTKPIRGVYCLYPGRELAWLAKAGKVRLGFFASAEEAGAARERHFAENPDAHPAGLGRGKGWTIQKCSAIRPYLMQCAGVPSKSFATQAEAEAAYAAAVAARRAETAKA